MSRLEAQRRLLHAAEESLLWRQAQQGLATERYFDAAQAVRMGLAVAPERFAPLIEPLLAHAGPGLGSELLADHDPVRAKALAQDAARGVVVASYAEGKPPASAAGVTLDHGEAVLRGVMAEYHVVPDVGAMARGAHERLGWVASALGVDPPALAASVEGVLHDAVGRGMPEAVATVEGVHGALAALDPYTRAVWPSEIATWTQHHEGVVVGVGLTLIDDAQGSVLVDIPAVGGAAWRAGVHQGDQVVEVAGQAVGERPAPRSVAVGGLLAGEPGTTVELVVRRGHAIEPFTLERETTPEVTALGWRRGADNAWQVQAEPYNGVTFVRIPAFRPDTDEAFDALIEGITPEAMVLDLRGNRGGDVMAAANIADRFIADGVVAELVGRTLAPQDLAEGEVAWNTALPGDKLEGIPVVVVVDRNTASSAELLAGALRERAGARLVGETTWGKGLSQGLRGDDAVGVAWQVTTGRWTLPSGRPLEGAESGLVPDVSVRLSAAEQFIVTVLRRQRETPTAHADGSAMRYIGSVGRPELPRLAADPQLEAAFAALDD